MIFIILSLAVIVAFAQRETYLYELLEVDEKATSD